MIRLLPLGLFAVLLLSPDLVWAQSPKTAAESPAVVESLTIDYGDGFQKRYVELKWTKEMTVLDLMNLAKAHRRSLRFVFRGKGATAFLTQIDDLKNEGQGKNWIVRVNGKLVDRSFALQTLNAGDKVSWTYEKFRFR